MAAIDLFAGEIAAAFMSGNRKLLAAFAHAFYSRFGFDKSVPSVDPEQVDAVKAVSSGFWIRFKDGRYLHYRRSPERWCVSESGSDSPESFDRHDYVIEKLGVPFAFLQGVSFAFECLEYASADKVSLFVEDAKKELAAAEEARREACEMACYWRAEAQQAKDKHRRLSNEIRASRGDKFLRSNGVVRRLTAGTKEPPPPPTETISLLAAKATLAGKSGVYFIWRRGEIVYVGRANCIAQRLSGHHVAQAGDYISVVEMPASESWIIEPYYIWKLRPRLNGEVTAMENVAAGRPARKRMSVEVSAR